jgi:hypothetical protein
MGRSRGSSQGSGARFSRHPGADRPSLGVALRRKRRGHCDRVGTRLFDPGRCWRILQAFTAQRFLKKKRELN